MLARKYRIPTEKFPKVTRGKTLQNELFRVVILKEEGLTYPRCAVIVSQKLAKTAVVRNRIRRQGYAVLGEIFSCLPQGYISLFPKESSFSTKDAVISLKTLLCLKK